jgi:hypothetical protein
MNTSLKKFQDLLRELFQFDSADLDFGIYRIMNHKRAVIERFVNEDLPEAVREELERDALAGQLQAVRELEEVTTQIKQNFGGQAIDAEGSLNLAYQDTPARTMSSSTAILSSQAPGRWNQSSMRACSRRWRHDGETQNRDSQGRNRRVL